MRKAVVRSNGWKKGLGPLKCSNVVTSKKRAGGKCSGVKGVVGKGPGKSQVDRIVKGKGRLEESEDDEDYQEGYEEVEEDDDDDYDYEEEAQSVSSSGDFMANMMMEYKKMKSRKRKGKVEQSVYRKQKIPKMEGHKVLSKGEVLKTHHENVGKYPNIVCRVESFCDSVKLFDLRRKQLVKQMGFGGLLELDMKNIPRQFCYWLMARVLEDGTIVTPRILNHYFMCI